MCVYVLSLYQKIAFFIVLAGAVLSLGHKEWPRVCTLTLHPLTWKLKFESGFCKEMWCSWKKAKKNPTNPKPKKMKPTTTKNIPQITASNRRSNGGMYRSLWRMWRQISSVDSAEEMYSSEERRCCCCLGLFIGTWQAEEYGKKGITVSERNPCLPSLLCFPFYFTRSGSPSPCAKSVVLGWGFKGSRGDFLGDTSFHQVLMLFHAVEENPGNS